jgi:hypothetical protein
LKKIGSQFSLSPISAMQEKGFLVENKRVRSFRLKFEPRFFKNARLALGFPSR